MGYRKDPDPKGLNAGSGRRGFLVGSTALALTATDAGSLFANRALAGTPRRGGRFRLGLSGGSTADNLDTTWISSPSVFNLSYGQIRNCLTEIAPDGTLIGELAESWEPVGDAATWTFKIRKGIEFHNGKTLTVDDVVASLNRHVGEGVPSGAKPITRQVASVKKDGENRIVIKLKWGSADWPYLMSDYHLGICPAKSNGDIDWRSGIGTGGYVLQSFEPGVRTLTKRNPNYWKEGRAHFDEVEIIDTGSTFAPVDSLVNGAIDAYAPVDLWSLDHLQRLSGIRVVGTTGNRHFTLPMWTDTSPFHSNDLRLALKYAVDRKTWLDVIMKGQGELGNDHPIGPANRFRATSDELPQRVYDPDKSRFHLRQTGVDRIDLKIHLSPAAFPGAIAAGELLSDSARPAGINIQVVKEAPEGYWDRVWLLKPWIGSFWGGRPTEDWMFRTAYETGAVWNETKWSHERFMKLLDLAMVELDQAKRRELYVELQRIVRDEGGAIIPVFESDIHALSAAVGTPATWGNNWELDGQKCAERWWFS